MAVEPKGLLDLVLDFLRPRGLHVNFIERGNDGQIRANGRVGIGHGLRLHALGRVHQQDSPFAGSQAAGDLVVEIDVPGGIDQVEFVGLTVEQVVNCDGAGFDCDAAFPFQVHIVEQLLAKFALADRP